MDNAVVLIVGFVVIALIMGVASGIGKSLGGIVNIILGGPLLLGFYGVVLKSVRREPVEFGQLFSGFQRFLPAFLANLILAVLTAIGCILCFIPGLFVAMLFVPLTFMGMYDRTLDFWPAIDQARQTVSASIGQWVLLFLVVLVLNIAGALACGVGIFVSIPLSAVLIALAYDQARA
jgi:uncharacterized membrane protein